MATPAQGQPEVGLKERFFRYFQHEVTALQDQMARLDNTSWTGGERGDAVDHCLAGIERLSHEVKDASAYIPAYDQRTYSEAIKALTEKLNGIRNTFAPPKKFAFKSAPRKNNSAISLSDAAELAKQNKIRVPGYSSDETSNLTSPFVPTPLDKLSPSAEKNESQALQDSMTTDGHVDDEGNGEGDTTTTTTRNSKVRTLSFSSAQTISISSHTNTHIQLPPSASHATSSGTVSHLRGCVIDLTRPTTTPTPGRPFASLTLKDIKDSLVVCGQVDGPAHITAVENSVLVVACRQFRMHACRGCDVYLWCGSRPIIEHCDGVRFADVPACYIPPALATSGAQNNWSQIDDFDWLKAEPSPHFSLLATDQKVGEDVWRDVVPGGHSVGVEDVLRAVGVAV